MDVHRYHSSPISSQVTLPGWPLGPRCRPVSYYEFGLDVNSSLSADSTSDETLLGTLFTFIELKPRESPAWDALSCSPFASRRVAAIFLQCLLAPVGELGADVHR